VSNTSSKTEIKLPRFDPIALEYPPLSESEYADLKASIARSNGLVGTKIILDAKLDTICEGVHRAKACKELGIDPTSFFDKRTFKNEIDKRSFIAGQNLARRNLKPEQREQILINNADWRKSDRALAKEHHTNRPAVKKAREQAEATGKSLPVAKRVGKDGKARKQPNGSKRLSTPKLAAVPSTDTKKIVERSGYTTTERLTSEWLVATGEQKSEFVNSIGLVKFYEIASDAQRAQLEAHFPTTKWKKENGLDGVKQTIDCTAVKALPKPNGVA
jgi:hypothetical protein